MRPSEHVRARALPIAAAVLLLLGTPLAWAGERDRTAVDHSHPRSVRAAAHPSDGVSRPDRCDPRGGRGGSCGKGVHRRSADPVFVTPWARHERAVELLRGRHPIRPLGSRLGHVIVTAEDLESAAVRSFVREAYAAGYVVAVTSAREDHARLLQTIAGATSTIHLGTAAESGAADGADPSRATGSVVDARVADRVDAALVMLRRHDEDDGGGHRIHSLWVEAEVSTASGEAAADWLSARFRTGDPEPGVGSTELCADPESCLQQVSQAKVFESHTSDSSGNAIDIQNEVYSTRSFAQGLDYYFVNQTGSYNLYSEAGELTKMRTVENSTGPSGTFVIDVAPASTTCTDTLITSVTESIGSSTGASSTKGGATFSAGVQYGTQNRLDCPDMQVVNRSGDANAEFERDTSGLPPTGFVGSSIANQFVYVVPIADEATEVSFKTTANLTGCNGCSNFPDPVLALTMAASSQVVDFPFPTKTPVAPKVSSVTPSTTAAGGIVTIAGEGFYSTALAALTINGIAVPSANILPATGSTPSDQQIQLLMPSAGIPTGTPLPVVVHTVYGISNDDQTITLEGGS